MDPLTIAAISAGVPLAMGMMMPNPQTPSGPNYSQALALMNSPQIVQARGALLNNSFNPNSNLYQLASNQVMAQTNRALAQRGMGNSGAGLQALNQAQTDLANQFQQNALNRQIAAFNAVTGQTGQVGNMMTNQANSSYEAALNAYKDQVSRQQNFMSGINSGVAGGLSAYQYNNMMDRLGYTNPSTSSWG